MSVGPPYDLFVADFWTRPLPKGAYKEICIGAICGKKHSDAVPRYRTTTATKAETKTMATVLRSFITVFRAGPAVSL